VCACEASNEHRLLITDVRSEKLALRSLERSRPLTARERQNL
jgi:hypothetical protein